MEITTTYRYPDDLLAGDIILTYKRRNPFSKAIYWFATRFREKTVTEINRRVSHAAVSIGYGKIVECSFHGLQIEDAVKYSTKTHVITVGTTVTPINRAEIARYAHEKVGKIGYGYLTLAAIAIKKIFGLDKINDIEADAQVCIEFVVQAYRDLYGIDLCPGIDSWSADPVDIITSPALYIHFVYGCEDGDEGD
ncbi:MAG TPA: hypothetical protein PKM65_20370 [Spirochaetota bacterium]|nr:hypothetical protein [Spirochaetota bacterium]